MSARDYTVELTGIRKAEEPRGGGRVFTILLFGVFFVLMMVALMSGVSVYRSVVQAQDATDNARQATALIANTIRANDVAGAFAIGTAPDGSEALVLQQTLGGSVFETRIYHYEGRILQEHTMAGNAYDPANAEVLAESDEFSFEYAAPVLTVHTSAGDTQVTLRSEGGE